MASFLLFLMLFRLTSFSYLGYAVLLFYAFSMNASARA